jgi:arginyl-tRNA synthetase
MAGWLPETVKAEHVGFGNMLGSDRKKFKTRAGGVVKLVDVLDEAMTRATAALRERSPHLSDDEIALRATQVSIGSIKYADLSTERIKDYVFDYDRMLADKGNTGPYLQYAHARISSIFKKATDQGLVDGPVVFHHEAERALSMLLLSFPEALATTLEDYQPSKLCTYLFELAQGFTTFYENCPVLSAGNEATVKSRLRLCRVTQATLAQGLELLGIAAPEQM